MSRRIIPVLLLEKRRLIKTTRFTDPVYIGDPVNAVRILIEKNIPELMILDIGASSNNSEPDYELLARIAGECTVPLIYGGGIHSMNSAYKVFNCGVEKIALNHAAHKTPELISEIATVYGAQSVVGAIDVARDAAGAYSVYAGRGKVNLHTDPLSYALQLQDHGCGEILLNNIDRDGMMQGYDTGLIQSVSAALHIPLIACGGAATIADFDAALQSGASAAAAGSMFLFKGRLRAVLISFPSSEI